MRERGGGRLPLGAGTTTVNRVSRMPFWLIMQAQLQLYNYCLAVVWLLM
jgi:hypothetical protein